MRTFRPVAGISTAGRSMRLALRMRVSMSATGSVIMMLGPSPTRLLDAGNQPVGGQIPEANAADAELGVDGAGVADTRQGDADEAVQELVHALAAERHPAADLVPLAEAEAADGHLRLGHLGALAGDLSELLGGLLHAGFFLGSLADAHV